MDVEQEFDCKGVEIAQEESVTNKATPSSFSQQRPFDSSKYVLFAASCILHLATYKQQAAPWLGNLFYLAEVYTPIQDCHKKCFCLS